MATTKVRRSPKQPDSCHAIATRRDDITLSLLLMDSCLCIQSLSDLSPYICIYLNKGNSTACSHSSIIW